MQSDTQKGSWGLNPGKFPMSGMILCLIDARSKKAGANTFKHEFLNHWSIHPNCVPRGTALIPRDPLL
jgi:hypothetical protein